MSRELELRSSLFILTSLVMLFQFSGPAATAAALDPEAINSAKPTANSQSKRGLNVKKALAAFAEALGRSITRRIRRASKPEIPQDLSSEKRGDKVGRAVRGHAPGHYSARAVGPG